MTQIWRRAKARCPKAVLPPYLIPTCARAQLPDFDTPDAERLPMPHNHNITANPCPLFDTVSKATLTKYGGTTSQDQIIGFVMDYYWLDLAQPRLSFLGQTLVSSPSGIHVMPFTDLPDEVEDEMGQIALECVMLSMDDVLVAALAKEVQGPRPYDWNRARVAVLKNIAVIMPAPPNDLIDIAMRKGSDGIPAAIRVLYQSGLSAHERLAALSSANQMVKTYYQGQRTGIDPSMRPIALAGDISVSFASDDAAT